MSDNIILKAIKDKFPDAVQEVIEFRGETTVMLGTDTLVEVAQFCHDDEALQLNYLADLSGVDYLDDAPRFGVNYVLYSIKKRHTIRLKVRVAEGESIPSITGVHKGAEWPEREVYDMFGVAFEGHPDLRRILMPFDWQGHPQRKDYPLGYEEVQFSFNFERVQAQKPHPKE